MKSYIARRLGLLTVEQAADLSRVAREGERGLYEPQLDVRDAALKASHEANTYLTGRVHDLITEVGTLKGQLDKIDPTGAWRAFLGAA